MLWIRQKIKFLILLGYFVLLLSDEGTLMVLAQVPGSSTKHCSHETPEAASFPSSCFTLQVSPVLCFDTVFARCSHNKQLLILLTRNSPACGFDPHGRDGSGRQMCQTRAPKVLLCSENWELENNSHFTV